jgi:pimeloyl-[acyl-carrier protein] methyl ester esterase
VATLRTDGAPALRYEDQGSGPPLLMLHGWSRSGADFAALAARLSSRHRVVRLDLRGHGASAPGPFTLPDLAGDVAALAETLDLRGALLLGWSLGAQVALAALPRLGARVGRLALVGATPRFTEGDGWPHGLPASAVAGLAARLRRQPERTLARFLEDCFAPGELDPAARSALTGLTAPAASGGLPAPDLACALAGLDLLAATDLRPALPAVTHPALLLHGEADAIVPLGAARALAALLPAARLVTFPATGHAPFLSREAEVAGLLEGFAGAAA